MAETNIIIEDDTYNVEMLEAPLSPPTAPPIKSKVIMDKTLGSASNLVKLLPSGTVLAFQTLAPSFANRGECYTSNKVLVALLILLCSLGCLFFCITDTVKGSDGKVYYGIATFRGMYIFNCDNDSDEDDDDGSRVVGNLRKYRLRMLDWVHAFFTMLIFQSLAFSVTDVQRCLFPHADNNVKELLENLPLGASILSSLVFMTFPTERKGIGFSDSKPKPHTP